MPGAYRSNFDHHGPDRNQLFGLVCFKMVNHLDFIMPNFKYHLHKICFYFGLRRVKWETDRSLNKLKYYFRPIFKYDLDYDVDPERLNYVYIYTILIVVVLYLVFQRAMALFCFCLKASRRIHEKLFNGVTRAQMYFFNTNSSGRIINRFSKDINDIDYYLPSVLYDSMLVSERKQQQFHRNYCENHLPDDNLKNKR